MKAKRWTFGIVLAAAVSLLGLMEANASPFSMFVLSDDLGNRVNGTAPSSSSWEDDGSGAGSASSTGEDSSGGTENDGHGNNEDGVDSSNKGQGVGGPTGSVDESCDGTGECVDDEMVKGSGTK